jgi:predicted short-subunit dehydrogenase-like oxidoreductase (DUF2520 family)
MTQSTARRRRLRIAIVGAGKVGCVLGRVLVERGHVITAVVSRTLRSARSGGRFLGCRRTGTDLSLIPAATEIVYITAPHGAIADIASGLAAVPHFAFRRLAVCHASGMHTAAVLEPLRELGAKVFSFHPLQTFPRDFAPRRIVPHARGIVYGVDGTPGGVRIARRMARELGGKCVLIPPDLRILYHAACVAASNHLTTMLWIVQRMYDRLQIRGTGFYPMFGPIVEATLANIARTSPAAALSGPIARGGTETVAGHFSALRDALPALIPYFASVSIETVHLASAKGSLDSSREEELLRLLHSYQLSENTFQEIP